MDLIAGGNQQEEMLKLSAAGDLKKLADLMESKIKLNLNYRNKEGWTALMLAARNGHSGVVKALLLKGADDSLTNQSGQTAKNIAEFWNHQDVINAFVERSKVRTSSSSSNEVNFFGYNPLDRKAEKRSDSQWIDRALKDPSTKFILLTKLSPYVVPPKEGKRKHTFCIYKYSQIAKFISDEKKPNIIFLGVETKEEDSHGQENSTSVNHGEFQSNAWFAVDVSHIDSSLIEEIDPLASVMGSHVLALMSFNDEEAGILAQARSMLAWHDSHKCCPTCGTLAKLEEAGYKRKCSTQECRSNRGVHNTSYPRLDPVVIMLVIHPSGEKCLLGRKSMFPPGMYSCLAGFMEPGETIEDAVRREVKEESGIKVGLVRYHSSQPWPQPSQIMIGCHCWAISTDIKIDDDELEDARWYTKQEAFKAVTQGQKGYTEGMGQEFFCPPRQAIAHQLLKAWATTSNL